MIRDRKEAQAAIYRWNILSALTEGNAKAGWDLIVQDFEREVLRMDEEMATLDDRVQPDSRIDIIDLLVFKAARRRGAAYVINILKKAKRLNHEAVIFMEQHPGQE